MPQSGLRGGRGVRAVGVATLNANSGGGEAKDKQKQMCRPNVADWQYIGVDNFTRWLEWNCARKARKGHFYEDTFAYGSYSSKDSAYFKSGCVGTDVVKVPIGLKTGYINFA